MEDYKKKYEEALENIQRIKAANKDNKELVNFIEYKYPELKESEDERIRRDIIRYLKKTSPAIGENIEKMLAWIEKQGEQKPQGKLALEVWKDMRLEVYQQASGNRHEPNYSDDSTKMFSLTDIDEIFEKVAEKQGEQKTTVKVEPKFKVGDTIVDKDPDEYNYETIKDIKDGRYIFTDGYSMNIDEQEGWQLVKTPANIEQKPTWSEEDERIKDNCIGYIETSRLCRKEFIECIDWLKSLKERMKIEFKKIN